MPDHGGFTSLGSGAAAIARDMYVTLSARLAERAAAATPLYPNIATVVPSKGKTQRYDFAKSLAEVREFLGERIYNKLVSYAYELVNRDWESSIEWKRDDLEDDQTGSLQIGIDEFINAMLEYPDELLTRFLNHSIAGTTTEFAVGFDGVVLFSAAHTWGAGVPYPTAQANLLTGSNTGKLDLTYGIANIQTAYAKLAGGFFWPYSDGATGVIRNRPSHILCSPSVFFDAQRLCTSAEVVAGSVATGSVMGVPSTNVLRSLNLIPVLVPGLTTGYWIMCDLNAPTRMAIFQNRSPIETEFMGPGTELWFKNRIARTGAFARYAVGSGLWFRAVAGNGT